jgi:putative redox protein
VHIIIEADIAPKKVIKAAALSFEKYCSVSITFEKSIQIGYSITLNNTILTI